MRLSGIFNVLFITALLLFYSNTALSENLLCGEEHLVTPLVYVHPKRGKVVVYKTPSEYTPQPEDLVCVTIEQFWKNRKSFPNKMTILVVREDFLNALILQVNLRTDTLTLIPVVIPADGETKEAITVWTILPNPLARITEMVRLGALPLMNDREGTKANYGRVTQKDLINISNPFPQE